MGHMVAVVGGGISGLCVAESLERKANTAGAPVRAVVLEAEKAAGGKIRSVVDSGFVIETGPHGFLDKEPLVFELIGRLGLDASLIAADTGAAKRFVLRKGRLRQAPSSPPGFLASDILPLFAKLRVLLEPWAKSRRTDEESVFEFATRRLGVEAAEILVDAMVTGIYGGDPRALSLRAAFPRIFELEDQYGSLIRAQLQLAKRRKNRPESASASTGPAAPTGTLHSFREGLVVLMDALAARQEVRTGFRVCRVEHQADASPRFSIAGPDGTVAADAMVVTTPALELPSLLGGMSRETAEAASQIPYAPVAVLVEGFQREDVGHPLDGFGFLVPFRESRRLLGSIWASSVFPQHAPDGTVLLRTLVGGARRPDLAELTEDELVRVVHEDMAPLIDLRPGAAPLVRHIVRWPHGIPQYTLGHQARIRAVDEAESRIPGLFVGGNGFRGVAMIQCIADADRIADRVLAHLSTVGP